MLVFSPRRPPSHQIPPFGQLSNQVKEKAAEHAETLEVLKQKAREQAEVLKDQAMEQAEVLKEKANELKEQYNVEELAEAHGVNTLLGRAPTPDDNSALWQRAVESLDLTYVTPRVVAMGMPYDRRQEMIDNAKKQLGATGDGAKGATAAARRRQVNPPPSKPKPGNNVDVVANLLNHRHKGRFMVWNVSEESYDYAKFNDQVLEVSQPASQPALPGICLLALAWLLWSSWANSETITTNSSHQHPTTKFPRSSHTGRSVGRLVNRLMGRWIRAVQVPGAPGAAAGAAVQDLHVGGELARGRPRKCRVHALPHRQGPHRHHPRVLPHLGRRGELCHGSLAVRRHAPRG